MRAPTSVTRNSIVRQSNFLCRLNRYSRIRRAAAEGAGRTAEQVRGGAFALSNTDFMMLNSRRFAARYLKVDRLSRF
jgi:hypothetical protein